jgi:ribosomal protein S18 acetylase RimI-like enzyme
VSARDALVPDVTLIPLSERERDAFIEEEIADYADQQVRDAGWRRTDALERARAELTPVLDREFAEGAEQGHQLWSATDSAGRCVGWLWVTPVEGAAERSAFLEQITVAAAFRRRGYGRAMLTALEGLLVGTGVDELRLTVFVGNKPARRLYGSAGYEQLDEDGRQCRLRKRLTRPSQEG